MLYYPINLLAIICIVDLLFVNYKRGLYLLLFIIPCSKLFYRLPIPGINITTILLFAAFFKADYSTRVFNQGHLSRPILLFLLIVLFSWVGVSALGSIPGFDSFQTLTFLKNWFTYIFLYFIYASQFDSKKDLNDLLKILLLGTLLQCVIANGELILKDNRRLHGLIGNSNDLGSFFAAYIFIFFLSFKKFSGSWRLLAGTGILTGLTGLAFALSRGAYLAFSVSFLFYIFKKSKLLIFLIVLSTILFSNIMFQFLPEKVKHRIEETIQTDEIEGNIAVEGSAYSRIPLAIGGLNMFLESPVWGKGFNTFHLIGMDYYGHLGVNRPLVAHNMYIQVLAELGIIGFIPFLLIFFRNISFGISLFNKKAESFFISDVGLALVCINISFAISCLFGNRLFNGNLCSYFWIFSAFVYKYNTLCTSEIQTKK